MHEKLFESIFITLELKNVSIIGGTIYRSSSHDTGSNQIFFDNLKETLESTKSHHKCFIFGDLHYNLLQYDNNMVNDLMHIMSDNSFYSLINKLTRITDTSATILDHVWTNLYSENVKTGVFLHPISHYLSVLTCYYTNQVKHNLDQGCQTRGLLGATLHI